MAELRKYATALDAATAGSTLVRKSLRIAGSGIFATGSEWTPAAGDVLVSKDGGAEANIAALPTYSNGAWEFDLSVAELTAKMVRIRVTSPAEVDDFEIDIETFGNAAAMWQDNYPALLLGAPATAGGLAGDIAALETGGGGTAPTAAEVADAVWAEALPGAYPAGQAGKIVGTNLDAPVSGVSTGGVSAAEIADAVWDEPLTAHNTPGTAGRAVRLARAQAKGKWQITGDNLELYDVDNTTLLATFALSPPGEFYTSRTATAELA